MKMKLGICILVITLVVFSNAQPFRLVHAQSTSSRQVTIHVKVIVVGIDPQVVNTSYVQWAGNLPVTTYGEVLDPPPGGMLTGMHFLYEMRAQSAFG